MKQLANGGEVRVFKRTSDLFEAAAEEILKHLLGLAKIKSQMSFILAGGKTPAMLYSLLENPDKAYRLGLPWERLHFFWGDERFVPANHPDSNYKMAYEMMLSKVPIKEFQIHRFKTEEADPKVCALDYEKMLKKFFDENLGLSKSLSEKTAFPLIDLCILGMGDDGHTASLFPGTDALLETEKWVVANRVEKLNSVRLTMTAKLLNRARLILFLVSGAKKDHALCEVLMGRENISQFPSQLIRPDFGRLIWLVDAEAARLIDKEMLSRFHNIIYFP